eukprot:CAMPEP_0197081496 /NCGR_PEP_ID=MMETSP1384-20130603/214666_1 /TAXON_ID=29189 /ORGANISM="Ammonia sp." /LENGTH=266 /DNA_ID=CAMNT_0042520391 /DNA_START=33 /DNA_END=829 /DNA_ORIENTATION=-
MADYLGFHQPKNGTCGFVAALHAIYLYHQWDQVINESMQQTGNQAIKPKFDYTQLLVSSIAHALITCASSAAQPLEYDAKPLAAKPGKANVAGPWKCEHCNTSNDAKNVFCQTCFVEPKKPPENNSNASNAQSTQPEMKSIAACKRIVIVSDGALPDRTDSNELLFYNETLFGFKLHFIDYDPKQDEDAVKQTIVDYLCSALDFERNYVDRGCCVRILLSLILTHGVDRCEYELKLAEYEEIVRQFRDESLVLGPYGFCSQNLVNL